MTAAAGQQVRRHRLQPPLLGAEDVERPRLTAAIRATVPSGTCILSAPPGFGATTAVAQALVDQPHVAWVAFDEFDLTAAHFWRQVSAALGEADGTDIEPPALPAGDILEGMSALVDWLARSQCRWIVLDGVDSLAHAAWLPALAYLSANLPRDSRLVLTTHDAARRMPMDPADRRLAVIDGEQLLADPDEAARIALAAAPQLDFDSLEEITSAAQGWVAAIRAAARHSSLHPFDNAGHWLTTQGSNALLGTWLGRLPPDRLRFLVDTAFLTQLCGPVCDVALESTGSLALLDALESCGSYLTVTPSAYGDDSLRWWSRHPLLTAALQQRLTTGDDPERDLRAAAWFEEKGDFESTMRHLLAAGRLDDASSFLRTHENALFEKGKSDRVAEFYASLPPDSWGQLGWHLVRVGWGQALSVSPQSADATLAQLRAHLATASLDESDQRVLLAEAATLTSYCASLAGDTTTCISSARSAIDLFCEENGDNSQQVAPTLLIRALLWEGDVEAARRELTRIRFQPFPTGLLRESAMGALKSQCLTDEGYITQGRVELTRAMAWLSQHGLTPIEVSQFALMTADGASTLESGDASGAVTRLEAASRAALDRGAVGDATGALIWLARARVSLGQLGDALACVNRARQLLHETAPTSPMLHRLDLSEALIRHIGGDAVRAERLVQRAPASDARTLMWARVTIHRQASAVRRSLGALDTDTPRIAIEKQVLLAMIAMKRSTTLAEGHLTRAADLAGDHGFQLALLGCPPDLLDLARSLASRTSHDSLARLLLGAQPVELPMADSGAPVLRGSTAGPPLSPGELALISFLPGRDSNAEIARQLGVSVNTVKTRLYRMYRKLGVDSRDQAIAAARSRGLIG